MGKGKKEYPTTKMDTGLYGSSVTNGSGTTYTPSSFQQQLVNYTEPNILKTAQEVINPSYNSELYQTQKEQRQKEQSQAYDSGVLSQLANRGLMRSSGLQAATNSFAETLANQEAQAMQNYQAQQAANLQTMTGLYSLPYDMMSGTSGLSQGLAQNVGNYNLQQQNANSGLFNALGTAIGTATGGIGGAYIGSKIGQQVDKY